MSCSTLLHATQAATGNVPMSHAPLATRTNLKHGGWILRVVLLLVVRLRLLLIRILVLIYNTTKYYDISTGRSRSHHHDSI